MNSPEIIREVLTAGTCDFVSLARAIHADPAFVGGVLRGERYRPCIACNVCIDNLGLGQVTCTVNPAVGRSRVPVPTPAVRPGSKVLVVGAGPGGLTAARELAEAGATVTLVDDGARPGGQFALAERMKSTPDFHRFAEWSASENDRLGVDVQLGTHVDTSDAAGLARDADAVIIATGGRRPAPGFIDAGSPRVSDVREWLAAHPEIRDGGPTTSVPAALTIWGADSVAMTVADTLAALGTSVLIVGPEESLAPESGRRAKILAVPRLEANPRVRIFLSSTIEEFDGNRVRISRAGLEDEWLEAPGELLVSRSVLPLDGPETLEDRERELSAGPGVPVALAGSVVDKTPAIVSNAVKSGYDAAQRIAAALAVDSAAEVAGNERNSRSFPVVSQLSREQTPTSQTRRLGLAQLSLLATAPPDLVTIAAKAGFDFIGARVRPVTATERPYDLQPGSPMLHETLLRMADTGVTVEDIEFLLLDGSGLQTGVDQRQAWLHMMEAGEALGASTLTVACADPDLDRFADHLAQMTQDGKAYGIMPTLEPIAYQAVRSIPQAVDLARRAGCNIVVDALHYSRFGGALEELEAAAHLVPLVQLCDGPATRPPTREGLVTESRSERGVPGEGDFDLRAILSAFPAHTPVSVETPSSSRVASIGELAWAKSLKAATQSLFHNAALIGSTQ
ncbi:FAD-dependent oxidoreductase [Paenarthrobacter sp. S56]|uniref:FAD-dependent oxidoreductase n=1 Tax=Paenarthrobacter sp. S56 TaxID=3138179 RepID=UPI003219BFC9